MCSPASCSVFLLSLAVSPKLCPNIGVTFRVTRVRNLLCGHEESFPLSRLVLCVPVGAHFLRREQPSLGCATPSVPVGSVLLAKNAYIDLVIMEYLWDKLVIFGSKICVCGLCLWLLLFFYCTLFGG